MLRRHLANDTPCTIHSLQGRGAEIEEDKDSPRVMEPLAKIWTGAQRQELMTTEEAQTTDDSEEKSEEKAGGKTQMTAADRKVITTPTLYPQRVHDMEDGDDLSSSARAGVVGGHEAAKVLSKVLQNTLHPETASDPILGTRSNQCDVTCVHTLGRGVIGTAQGADDGAISYTRSKVAADDDIGTAYRLPCQETNEAPMVIIGSCTFPKVRLSTVASAVNMASTVLTIKQVRPPNALPLARVPCRVIR